MLISAAIVASLFRAVEAKCTESYRLKEKVYKKKITDLAVKEKKNFSVKRATVTTANSDRQICRQFLMSLLLLKMKSKLRRLGSELVQLC